MTTTIKATVHGRRLELEVPAEWPDGTEVEIQLLQQSADSDEMSPEEIAKLLAALDQFEPVEMTDAELAAWEAERKARRDQQKARFMEHAEEYRRMWDDPISS
jgi:hypothetical protein